MNSSWQNTFLSPKNVFPACCLVLALFFTLFLRLYHLGFENYWIDEMSALHFAKSPVWHSLFWDNSPGLYLGLLKTWVFWHGDGESTTRSLSVIFSGLGLVALGYYGFRKWGVWGATLAILFQGVLWLSIYQAREARPYALFEMFATLNLIAFLELQKRPEFRKYFLLSLLPLALSHYIGLGLIFLEFLWLYYSKGHRRPTRGMYFIFGTILLLAAALIKFSEFSAFKHTGWQQLKYLLEPNSWLPTVLLWSLLNKSWICFGGALILITALFKEKVIPLSSQMKSLSFIFVATLSFFLILSVTLERTLFIPRYFQFFVPLMSLFFLNAAFEQTSGPLKKWAFAGFAIFVTGAVISIPHVLSPLKAPWQMAAHLIAQSPSAEVFTTRTLTIATPYFERENIPVKKLLMSHEAIQQIESALDAGKTPWVLENYWGASNYLNNLKLALIKRGFKVSAHTIRRGEAEPLEAVRIGK